MKMKVSVIFLVTLISWVVAYPGGVVVNEDHGKEDASALVKTKVEEVEEHAKSEIKELVGHGELKGLGGLGGLGGLEGLKGHEGLGGVGEHGGVEGNKGLEGIGGLGELGKLGKKGAGLEILGKKAETAVADITKLTGIKDKSALEIGVLNLTLLKKLLLQSKEVKGGILTVLKEKFGGEVGNKLTELISSIVGVAGGSEISTLSAALASKLAKSGSSKERRCWYACPPRSNVKGVTNIYENHDEGHSDGAQVIESNSEWGKNGNWETSKALKELLAKGTIRTDEETLKNLWTVIQILYEIVGVITGQETHGARWDGVKISSELGKQVVAGNVAIGKTIGVETAIKIKQSLTDEVNSEDKLGISEAKKDIGTVAAAAKKIGITEQEKSKTLDQVNKLITDKSIVSKSVSGGANEHTNEEISKHSSDTFGVPKKIGKTMVTGKVGIVKRAANAQIAGAIKELPHKVVISGGLPGVSGIVVHKEGNGPAVVSRIGVTGTGGFSGKEISGAKLGASIALEKVGKKALASNVGIAKEVNSKVAGGAKLIATEALQKEGGKKVLASNVGIAKEVNSKVAGGAKLIATEALQKEGGKKVLASNVGIAKQVNSKVAGGAKLIAADVLQKKVGKDIVVGKEAIGQAIGSQITGESHTDKNGRGDDEDISVVLQKVGKPEVVSKVGVSENGYSEVAGGAKLIAADVLQKKVGKDIVVGKEAIGQAIGSQITGESHTDKNGRGDDEDISVVLQKVGKPGVVSKVGVSEDGHSQVADDAKLIAADVLQRKVGKDIVVGKEVIGQAIGSQISGESHTDKHGRGDDEDISIVLQKVGKPGVVGKVGISENGHSQVADDAKLIACETLQKNVGKGAIGQAIGSQISGGSHTDKHGWGDDWDTSVGLQKVGKPGVVGKVGVSENGHSQVAGGTKLIADEALQKKVGKHVVSGKESIGQAIGSQISGESHTDKHGWGDDWDTSVGLQKVGKPGVVGKVGVSENGHSQVAGGAKLITDEALQRKVGKHVGAGKEAIGQAIDSQISGESHTDKHGWGDDWDTSVGLQKVGKPGVVGKVGVSENGHSQVAGGAKLITDEALQRKVGKHVGAGKEAIGQAIDSQISGESHTDKHGWGDDWDTSVGLQKVGKPGVVGKVGVSENGHSQVAGGAKLIADEALQRKVGKHVGAGKEAIGQAIGSQISGESHTDKHGWGDDWDTSIGLQNVGKPGVAGKVGVSENGHSQVAGGAKLIADEALEKEVGEHVVAGNKAIDWDAPKISHKGGKRVHGIKASGSQWDASESSHVHGIGNKGGGDQWISSDDGNVVHNVLSNKDGWDTILKVSKLPEVKRKVVVKDSQLGDSEASRVADGLLSNKKNNGGAWDNGSVRLVSKVKQKGDSSSRNGDWGNADIVVQVNDDVPQVKEVHWGHP